MKYNNINNFSWKHFLLLFVLTLTYVQAKVSEQWLSNAASFAGGGVGGKYMYVFCVCVINEKTKRERKKNSQTDIFLFFLLYTF